MLVWNLPLFTIPSFPLTRYQLPLFVGLVDYSSDSNDTLVFKKGNIIHIINTDEQERWFGLHKAIRQKGYFPKLHVREKLERMRYECCIQCNFAVLL